VFRKLCILFVTCALLVPVAMPSPAAARQSNKLVVASFYPVDMVSGWDGLVAAFHEVHPDVEIEVQVTAFDQYLPKLLSQIAGGDSPDIAGVENTPFPEFVNHGILTNLNPYLAATEGFSLEDFFPHLIDRYTYDGNVYGIPYDAQPRGVMFYNPGIFDEAGVSHPTNDWTWDDFVAAGEKLNIVNGDTVERYAVCSDSTYNLWQYFLLGGGGNYVDDLRNPTRSLLDQPEALEATQFTLDLIYEKKLAPTPAVLDSMGASACSSLFTQGKVAMMLDGFWRAVESPTQFAELHVGMVMAPVKDTSHRVYGTGGTAYTILESSKNKDLAWEFLTMFLGPEGYKAAFEASTLGAIYPPAHIPSFDWYMSQDLPFVDSMAANKEALAYIQFAPYLLNWTEISDRCITPNMDLILRDEAPAEPMLQTIAGCVNGELG
jgi:multiple sugar transport system substrate-binding protein